MTVPEMGKLLGLKKTDRYWLLGVDDYLVYELLKKNQIEQVHIWIP